MGEYLGRMATQENNDDRIALLQEVFLVDHGSLYVALQRLENKKWISAKWGVSENNRKARFYSLTTKGREQLVEKIGEWRRLAPATGLILEPGSRLLGEEA
jgi:PadR family transcriptional regulator PadR